MVHAITRSAPPFRLQNTFLVIALVWVPALLASPFVNALSVRGTPADDHVCGPMLGGAANYLVATLDPFTGLPYDQGRCDCRWASPLGVCQSGGVLPQLPEADITPFSQLPPTGDFVSWGFVDDLAGGEDPSLLYAFELALDLSAGGNEFGGLIWTATADITRYDRLRIRYRTASPTSRFELKLNSGLAGDVREITVELDPSPIDGTWADVTLDVATAFPGTDLAHLNYLVFATSLAVAGENQPVLWVDHLAFLADPASAASCAVVPPEVCALDPSCYPDLDHHEPHTGAVNIANALSALTFLPELGLLDATEAENRLELLLDSLAATPRIDGWMQDWHSPASLMPLALNRIGSTTDLPQLYAALMVVEQSWPSLAATAASLRAGMIDFSDLWDPVPDGSCPGTLYWAMNLCDGLQTGPLEYFGNDTLLAQFLAVAGGAAPPLYWSECIVRKGCELRGVGAHRWYTTGAFACDVSTIPAAETGGPFLQLAGLTYLDSAELPIGTLSLGESAANMLAAQRDWAADQALGVWGWANHGDADSCDYRTCEEFLPDVVTPYISGMGLSLEHHGIGASCAENLLALDGLGVGLPLDSGTLLHDFGPRDAWNQQTDTTRHDAYLYLDSGWLALGAINHCFADLVRQRFAAHPVAMAGYALLDGLGIPCPGLFDDGFESGDTSGWSSGTG